MLANPPHFSLKHLLAGGVILLSFGLVFEQLGNRIPQLSGITIQPATATPICDKILKPKTTLSRQKLAQLLTVSPGKSRATIRGIVQEPYCKLPNLEVRAGTTSEREAYPLAFDPHIWLVVLYEGDSYAGYDFLLR